MVGAELNQKIYEFCMDLLGPEILYHNCAMHGANALRVTVARPGQRRYLLAGPTPLSGTSEVMRNILGERVLGLPGDLPYRCRHAMEGGYRVAEELDSTFAFHRAAGTSGLLSAGPSAGPTSANKAARRVMETDVRYDPQVWRRLGSS